MTPWFDVLEAAPLPGEALGNLAVRFLVNSDVPPAVRIGTAELILGVPLLLMALIHERISARRHPVPRRLSE